MKIGESDLSSSVVAMGCMDFSGTSFLVFRSAWLHYEPKIARKDEA